MSTNATKENRPEIDEAAIKAGAWDSFFEDPKEGAKWYSTTEVAKMFGLSKQTIYKRIKAGMPAIASSASQYRFFLPAVIAWMSEHHNDALSAKAYLRANGFKASAARTEKKMRSILAQQLDLTAPEGLFGDDDTPRGGDV